MLPQTLFHCLLDEVPLDLVPAWEPAPDPATPLIVNPRLWVSSAGTAPGELAERLPFLDQFFLDTEVTWVEDPATGFMSPFWLGQEYSKLLAGLSPGEPVRRDFPQPARAILTSARLLVGPGFESRRRQQWRAVADWARLQFQTKGYVPLRRLIHPFHLAALRRYVRDLRRRGRLRNGDTQVRNRYIAHNESVTRFFHHQLTSVVSDVAGEPVKPSYVYTGHYHDGAVLHKHVDRAQCQFSISLLIDYSPEPQSESPWPIRLDTKEGVVAVYQALGDGLVYKGCEVPHSRERLPDGHTSTSCFLHYVPREFAGLLE